MPEEKDGLLELFKKLWLPVAGFLGAVTLAYNFYQLWLGDQKAVTYIAAGGGLFVLIAALIWVGFSKRNIIRPAVWPIGAIRTEIYPRFELPYRKSAWVGLGAITLIAIFGFTLISQHRHEREQKLIVVIATFEGPEEVYGLRNEIIERLNSNFSQDQAIEIVAVSNIVTPDQGAAYALELGKHYLADMVIWGWYRPTQNPNITIHIEITSPQLAGYINQSSTYQPTVTLAEMESFAFQQQLGGETTALINTLAGLIEYQAKNYPVALLLFDKSLAALESSKESLFNDQIPVYVYRGTTYLEMEQYNQAIADYTKAIQLNSQDAFSYNNRGSAYYFLKQYDEAIADYTKAVQLDPLDTFAYSNRGTVFVDLNQFTQAVSDYSIAIQLDPQLAEAYSNRGNAYNKLTQYDQAVDDLSKAIQLNPQYANAYFNRGNSYRFLRLNSQAIYDYTNAINLNPKDEEAYYNRGGAYADLEQYEDAIADFTMSIQLDPMNINSYYQRGLAYQELRQYDQSVTDFTKVIQLDPVNILSYYQRGLAYQKLQQYDQSAADFTMAIQLDPIFFPTYNDRGNTYAHQKQYEQAIADYTQAILLSPEFAVAYGNRSHAYQLLGKTAEAEVDLAKYKELTGQDAP